jgi:hypothetical protein
MLETPQNLIQALWPLPGGNGRYLATLDYVIKWTAGSPGKTRADLSTWFMNQYNVGSGSVGSYLQVILKLGVLNIDADNMLQVTPFGKQVMEASGEDKASIVVERFMRYYLAFREVLAVYADALEPIHLRTVVDTLQPQFTQWTSDVQFDYRVLWLLSCGCLRQVKGRYYEITDFGRRLSQIYLPSKVIDIKTNNVAVPQQNSIAAIKSQVHVLIDNLTEAAAESHMPQNLEHAVAEAFEYLGFSVDQLGESGETDVLIRAVIGPESYTVVADAKARKTGKLLDLEVYTLLDHKKKNEADYAIVIAGDFAGGKIPRHAQDNGIVLLPIPLLCDWLRVHEETPLSLSDYRPMFMEPGLRSKLAPQLSLASEQKVHWARLIVDLIDLIQETYQHGLVQTLPSSQLFTMLVTRLRGVRYSTRDVDAALDLLCHPAIGTLRGSKQEGITLDMNRKTLANTLKALATLLENEDSDPVS